MKKKIILISGISCAAIILIVVLFFVLKPASQGSKAIDAIPGNPSLIIETKDFNTFVKNIKTDNLIFQELRILFNINSSNSIIHYVDSLRKYNSFKSAIGSGNMIFSYNNTAGKLLQTAICEFPSNIKDKRLIKDIENDLKNQGQLKEREYKGANIYEYIPKSSTRLFYAVKNHLLIVSFSATCIESSLDNLADGKNLCKRDPGFASIYASSGKKELANVYINLKTLPENISGFITPSAQNSVKNMRHFSGWTGLDMTMSTDKLSLNGFIYDKDTCSNFTKILKSQQVTQIISRDVLPDNTSFYTTIAFNNHTAYNKALIDYLKLSGTHTARETAIAELKNTIGLDIRQSFYPMIENEICLSVTNAASPNELPHYYTTCGLKSQTSGILAMDLIVSSIAGKTGKPVNDYKTELKIDAHTIVPCYHLSLKDLPALLFGDLFINCSGEYVCFINNFMVFSDSKESLHQFAYSAYLNKTLATNIDHNKFLENFSDKSLMFTYFSFPGGDVFLKRFMNDTVSKLLNINKDALQRIGYSGYQINIANGLLYNIIVLQHSSEISEKPKTIWESRLENSVFSKPTLVINHNDNSKEIMVQDDKNILYLLSNSGREVWKLKLDEQISSRIYQIDLYKNGKFQYLFSTKSKLHLIDRLGNYIEKFPITLRSASTAPMALFDYESNKDYRILIPCEDKKIYVYDANGSLVKGWAFDETEHEVLSEINRYVSDGEDFLVFHDKYKSYFISRTGESKIDFLTTFQFSDKNKISFDNSSAPTKFVTTDSKGIIRFFLINGDQDSLKIKTFGENHYFLLEDINGDGDMDYVFAEGKKMEIYTKSKKLIFSYDFEYDISEEPVFYKFPSNQTKIGIVCKSGSKIYLINADGSLFNGFPLHGLTQFSIGYLSNTANKFNLLVGGPENLLYNYEVNEN